MDPTPRLLGPLGVSGGDEFLYRRLLARPESTVVELSRATGWDRGRLRRQLRSLESLGLATRTGDRPARFVPAAPEAAVEVLALHRQAEIERARLAAARLTREYRPPSPTTLIRGAEAGEQRLRQALQVAQREILALCPAGRGGPGPAALRAALGRGVACRSVHDEERVGTAAQLGEVRELAGEGARMLHQVPLALVVVDRRLALVAPGPHELLEVLPSPLLDGLLLLFDLLWQRATPLSPPPSPARSVLSRDDERLLSLAAAGLTDQAIARRLGVAQRTVERRMQRILAALGARTRFQAGLRAAEQGLLRGDLGERQP